MEGRLAGSLGLTAPLQRRGDPRTAGGQSESLVGVRIQCRGPLKLGLGFRVHLKGSLLATIRVGLGFRGFRVSTKGIGV